ncbi:endo-1,4-beta-xylanase xylA, putative (macronuclear) [Tetrahymena thermophila SB210]|uniref:Endo-1,4-beta-xylanase xylA, putative n=1 Tax=Tetrahymena thermophila (strain SB210) TaxID=312017 RepID=I7M6E1_TETTS|nr:endo-1,4-beta-xylanase xylA, putative [Tetrahymena thermophila SB210]EAR85039.2 endo-1,4-beta-xylanase xylA, putative [Tetrahymena thermophila SB210]|eukprot:XP_001032702.2 endo-1,4-beta-xylanase xylA, putative [Tetrahymena thermophila SB210]
MLLIEFGKHKIFIQKKIINSSQISQLIFIDRMQRKIQKKRRGNKFKDDIMLEETGKNTLSSQSQSRSNQIILLEQQYSLDKQFINKLDLELAKQNQNNCQKESLTPWESKEASKLSFMNDLEIDNQSLFSNALTNTKGSQTEYKQEKKKFILPLHQIRNKFNFANTPTLPKHEQQTTQLSFQNQEQNLKSENSFQITNNGYNTKNVQNSKHQFCSNQQFLPKTQEDCSKNFGSTSLLDQEESNYNQNILRNKSNSLLNYKKCQQSNENITPQSKKQDVHKQFQKDQNYFISQTQSSGQTNKLDLIKSSQQIQKISQENQNMFTPRFIHISSNDSQKTQSVRSNSQSQSLEQFTQIKNIQNFLQNIQTDSNHHLKNKINPFKNFYYQSSQTINLNNKVDLNYEQEMHKTNLINGNFRSPSFLHINKVDIQKSNTLYQKNKLQNQQKTFYQQTESNKPIQLNLNFSSKIIDTPKRLMNNNEENGIQESPYQANQHNQTTDQIQNINYFKSIFPKQNDKLNLDKKRQNTMSESQPLQFRNSTQRMLQSSNSEFKQGESKMITNSFSSKKMQQKNNLIYFLNDEALTKQYGFQTPRKAQENNTILTERLWKTGPNFFQMNQKRSKSNKNSFYKQNNYNSDKQECSKVDINQYKNFQIFEDFIQKKEQENSLKKSNQIMNQNMMKYKQHMKQKKQLKQEEDQQINTLLQSYVQNQYSQILQKIIKTKKIMLNTNQFNINISQTNLQKKNIDQIQINHINIK